MSLIMWTVEKKYLFWRSSFEEEILKDNNLLNGTKRDIVQKERKRSNLVKPLQKKKQKQNTQILQKKIEKLLAFFSLSLKESIYKLDQVLVMNEKLFWKTS